MEPATTGQLWRHNTAAASTKAAPALFAQLGNTLKGPDADTVRKLRGLVVFKIDGEDWTLDLREDSEGAMYQGAPKDSAKPDLTLTISDSNFAQLVYGKMSPQQAFLLRKLKINGSMSLAMKLQPVLDAAQPKARM